MKNIFLGVTPLKMEFKEVETSLASWVIKIKNKQ